MRKPTGTVDLERRAVVKSLASLTAASALWPTSSLSATISDQPLAPTCSHGWQ